METGNSWLQELPGEERLRDLDGVLLRLHLEFQEDFELDWRYLLRLRREIYQVGRMLLETGGGSLQEVVAQLLFPPPSTDICIRRLAPVAPVPFILQLKDRFAVNLAPGDALSVDCLLVGRARFLAEAVPLLFRPLGQRGIFNGRGQFTLESVEAVSPDGVAVEVWRDGEMWREPAWPLVRLWPEKDDLPPSQLTFVTPARILVRGKPLFRPGLRQLVSAMVRRVCALAAVWCDIDLLPDPQGFLAALPATDVRGDLRWEDWRPLDEGRDVQALGGISGSVRIPPDWWDAAGPFIRACRWFNLGKGAAYGAGAFRLD